MPLTLIPQSGPLVFVVVLNWNGWKDSIPCIQSIQKSSYLNTQIVVVDNGSTDDSVDRIRQSLPDITILETGTNLGFATGNNHGIRYALGRGADYILVLNNDTIVPEDSILKLVEFAEATPDAALIGPAISDSVTGEFLDLPMLNPISVWSILLTKSPIQRIIRHTRLYRRFFYLGTTPHVVYAVHGSAMMFRTTTIQKVGMFDEETFIYWEEFILAEKMRATGLLTYIVPSINILHKGGASISKIGAFKFLENVKSEKYFFEKYLSLPFTHRLAIKTIRFVGYMGRAALWSDYRRQLPKFFRLLFAGDTRAKGK